MGQEDAKTIFNRAIKQVQIYNIEMSMDVKNTDNNGRVKEKSFDVLLAKFGEVEKTRMIMQKPERAAGVTIIFTKPPGEIGSIEVFTPANGKTRKMKATPDNTAMVGFNFSFSDFATRGVDDIDFTMLGTEEVDGQSCYKIGASEKSEEGANSRVEFLVEKNSSNIVQIIIYDEKGKQKNISKLSDFQPIEGIKGKSQPMLILSEDLLNKKSTEIKVQNITAQFNLKEEDFSIEKASSRE